MHLQNEIDQTITQRNVVGLTLREESRLRRLLRKFAPSEPWVDVQFRDVPQFNQRGNMEIRRLHDPSAFPPGGNKTRMIRCPICGVLTPPQTIEAGACLDHANHSIWPTSPSARTIWEMENRNGRLRNKNKIKLKPESEDALIRKIGRYQRRMAKLQP